MDYLFKSFLRRPSRRSATTGPFVAEPVRQGIIALLHLLSVLGVILGSLVDISKSLADPPSQEGSASVDVVVLVDSSASMRLSDPEQLRKQAVASFASSLGPNDRIALAEFSESAQILAPFEAGSSSTSLAQQIAALGDSGEFTDIFAAINLGAKLFRDKGRSGVRKLMIVLSDGKMDPSPREYSPSEATAKLVGKLLPEVKEAGIEVHTIALSDESDRELLSQIALLTDGVGWYVKDASALGDTLREILRKNRQPLDGAPFAQKILSLEEGLAEVILYVRQTPGSRIRIVSPQGERYSGSEPAREGFQWFQNEEFILLAINNPRTGDWIVEGLKDPDEFVAILKDLRATVRWPSALFVGSDGVIEALLLEGSRPVSIPALSRAIKATVQVVSTERVAEPLVSGEMVDDGTLGDLLAEDGVFSRQAIVGEQGNFKVLVTLRGPFFERSAQQTFVVSPVLMQSAIEFSDHPFSTLVKGYKDPKSSEHEDDLNHGGSAHGSHGAGEHDEQHTDNAHTVDRSVQSSEANHSADPGPEDVAPSHQQSVPHSEGEAEHEHADSGPKGFPVIRIELEREVLTFRKHEVVVISTDTEGREHPVPLYPSVSSEEVLLGNLADLPKPGAYRVQARLKVKKKLGLEQQYFGPWLPFERPKSFSTHPVSPVEEPPQKSVSFVFPISVVSVFNLLIGGGLLGFALKRRADVSRSERVTYSYPDDLEMAVGELEQIAKESEIALDDPRLNGGADSASVDANRRDSGGAAQTVE